MGIEEPNFSATKNWTQKAQIPPINSTQDSEEGMIIQIKSHS